MAYLFLTNKERDLYQKVPQKIEEEVLWKSFLLSKENKIFIHFFHGNQSKVAVALQVGIIRLLGFLPEGWNIQINNDWINFIMEQLKIDTNPNLLEYGNRPATRTGHLQQIMKHLNYRRWQPIMDEAIIEKWLIERGMEHDNERWLLEKLCQKLYRLR